MSIYVLIEYIEECKKVGSKPTWEDLKQFYIINWR